MKKSDLEAEREAAAYNSDVGASLDDSEKSEHATDFDFDADDILAQRIWEDDVPRYLVKFADYPIHRCEWLPQGGLSQELFETWRKKRKEIGPQKLEKLSNKNRKAYEKARKRADAAKQRRHEKREMLRQEAARKKSDAPHRKGVAKNTVAPAHGHPTPVANYENKSTASSAKRRVVMVSEGESSTDSSDSEPILQRRAKLKVSTRSEHGANAKIQSKQPSPQSRRTSSAAFPSTKSSEAKTGQYEQRRTSSTGTRKLSENNVSETNQPQATSATQPGALVAASSSAIQSSIEVATSTISGRTKTIPTAPVSYQVQEVSGTSDPIKIVNQPKHPQRKAWDTQGKHFTTLHYRSVAEKRSRAEGTPDINELDFVNGAPPGLELRKKTADTALRAHQDETLYGRREPAQRRPAGIDAEDGPVFATGVALRHYEVGKIPMACFDWKHNTCPHGAERCRFLHRENDQDGKPLPLTSWDGKIPPKFRDPPETCWFWFRDDSCKKTPDECIYAHVNTGHLWTLEGKAIAIDPNVEPGSTAAREICGIGQKHTDVTCWNWLRDTKGCPKTADQCTFAHTNTGLLGNTVGADFIPIDLNEKPVRNLPKFRNPPQTCFFWLRGKHGCEKSTEDCGYAHDNTGWLAHKHQGVLQIDRNEKPRKEAALRRVSGPTGPVNVPTPGRHLPLHMKTCFFWNEYCCEQTEEACRCLHRYTGVVAELPRNSHWQFPPGWKPHLRDDPNSMQFDEPSPMHISNHDTMQIDKPVDEGRNDLTSPSLQLRGGENLFPTPVSNSIDEETTVPSIQPGDMVHKIETALPLDYEELFRCNGDQYEDIIARPNALVLYDPEEHMQEHELISRWLLMNHVTVFNFWMGLSDAWNAFKKLILEGDSGIIIASPDFEGYASLPGFGDVLRSTVRLWSIGYQEGSGYSIWDPKASPELHYDRFEIFPHGGVIYITDDVFEKKPQLALKIVEHFFAKIEAGRKVDSDIVPGMYITDGLLLWRLGVRPELIKWIGDTCMNRQTEIEGRDPDYVSLEKLYVLLHDSGYCEPDSTFEHPADNRRLDFYPIISAREDLAEEIGLYYEARKRSQYDAYLDMAHHYSGLVVMERRNYRQYFVVHTKPEELDWKETITNIDEIMTPEKCIEYFEQQPKGSRFDNYEWSYPEKKADSVTS